MKRYYYYSLILSPLIWFAASAFQTSSMSNPLHRDDAITMISTTKSGREETIISSRRGVLQASFAAAVSSLVSIPTPADAVCCHNKRQSTLHDKRMQQKLQLRQFRLLPRRGDIVQVGSSSPSHRRGIASAILAPTSGGGGVQCALSALE